MPQPRYVRAVAPLDRVLPCLPENYFARDNVDHTLIFGADDAAHTLDAHVLPRLAKARISVIVVGQDHPVEADRHAPVGADVEAGVDEPVRVAPVIADDAGVDTDFTSHSLRHTFGTTLDRDGHDLVLVADLLGHQRLETTRGYSLPTAEDRQRAINSLPTDH